MENKEKEFHFIYMIESKFNGKYYLGMHSTNNLDDGYMGSGKRLTQDIKKYGSDAYEKHILEFVKDRESLIKREREVVTPDVINNWYSLNMIVGGDKKSDKYFITEWSQKEYDNVFFQYMVKDNVIRNIISYLIPYHTELGWVKCTDDEVTTYQENKEKENQIEIKSQRLTMLKELGLTDSEALEKLEGLDDMGWFYLIKDIKNI